MPESLASWHLVRSARKALEDDMDELRDWPKGEPVEIEVVAPNGAIVKQEWRDVDQLLAHLQPTYEAILEALDDIERDV